MKTTQLIYSRCRWVSILTTDSYLPLKIHIQILIWLQIFWNFNKTDRDETYETCFSFPTWRQATQLFILRTSLRCIFLSFLAMLMRPRSGHDICSWFCHIHLIRLNCHCQTCYFVELIFDESLNHCTGGSLVFLLYNKPNCTSVFSVARRSRTSGWVLAFCPKILGGGRGLWMIWGYQ